MNMNICCCITIDVEVDKDPHYRVNSEFSFKNITQGIADILEPLFCEFGAAPTYLISSEVLLDQASVRVLRDLTTHHELGTHGHAECLLLRERCSSLRGKDLVRFVSEDDFATELENLGWLTDLFKEKFGYNPKTFRGGRFGVGDSTFKALVRLGYTVDTSVTPGCYWRGERISLNFVGAPEQPYYLRVSGNGFNSVGLMELPISVWTESALRRLLGGIVGNIPGGISQVTKVIDRLFEKVIPPYQWIRPTLGLPEEHIVLLKRYLARHAINTNILVNVMFHSFEVIPGASPYALDETGVQRIICNLKTILATLKQRGAIFVTCQEAAEIFRSDNSFI